MSHLYMGPRKTMNRRQFRCTLNGSCSGSYDKVPPNMRCSQRANEPGQFIRGRRHHGCALSTPIGKQTDAVPLKRNNATNTSLRSPALFVTVRKKGRASWNEAKLVRFLRCRQTSPLLSYSFPTSPRRTGASTKRIWERVKPWQCGSALLVARMVTSMFFGHARELIEKQTCAMLHLARFGEGHSLLQPLTHRERENESDSLYTR
jgi:hypothetical protein